MLAIINSFLFIFFTALTLDIIVFGIKISHLFVILISAALTSAIAYKLKIIHKDSELSFLYLNLYSLYLRKYFVDFIRMILSLHRPFLLNFKAEPTLFKVQINDHDKVNKVILASAVNLSQGTLIYDIDGDIALIYCLNEQNYTSLNFLRLNKDIKDLNDNSLV